MCVLLGVTAAMAISLIDTTTVQAAYKYRTVTIAGETVDRDHLNMSTYYKATKTVSVKIGYEKNTDETKGYTKTMKLPKGTIVAGMIVPKHKLPNGKWDDQLSFVVENRLNYALFNRNVRQGYRAGYGIAYPVSTFKKIKTPAYMPTWSYGDLYLGGAKAIDTTSKRSAQITTNGYVELHEINKNATLDEQYTGRPYSTAKIAKTRVKDATRYLYLKGKLKGLKTVRVGKKGAYQYRLALMNRHQPQNRSSYDDDRGEYYDFYSLYALGGVTYYTAITSGSDVED